MPGRISIGEYNRIKELVSANNAKAPQDQRRDDLKRLSDARVARWPNTLQALRKQKETAFLQRKAKREEENLAIDREEDERRARDRREKIEYASKTIYRSTEKMKRLQSAEILVECVDARNQQVKLNQRMHDLELEWEKQFLEMDKARRDQMKAREDAEREERSAMAKEVARIQQEQLDEVKQRYRREVEAQREEGRAIAARAEEEKKEDIAAMREREQRARQTAQEITEANRQLNEIRAAQLKVEQEEDMRTQEYARKKEDLATRQRAQAERIAAMKQKKRQEMIDEGVRRLAAFTQNDEQRTENQMREARAAEDELARVREEKRREFGESIKRSRERQLARQKQERDDNLRREQEFALHWREHNRRLEDQQREEDRAELRAAKEHQEFLRVQMHEKRMREKAEKQRDGDATKNLLDNLRDEEEEFYAIAKSKVKQFVEEGKDPYPVLKCVADVKKKRLMS